MPASLKSSSIEPSQSLSRLSQTSVAVGPGVIEHCTPLPLELHTLLPWRAHWPTPAVHGWPRVGKPLSITPSQSSSTPLQSSVCGLPAVAEHVVPVPAESHLITPNRWQPPWPALHGLPRFAKPSSVLPSQSSSRPLQISAAGVLP